MKIITDFLEENKENYKGLQNTLLSYENFFQYVYSNVFQEIYCSTKRRGFDLKSNFHIIFQTYKDIKKSKVFLGKSSENYETISNETSVFEQKEKSDQATSWKTKTKMTWGDWESSVEKKKKKMKSHEEDKEKERAM